MNKGHKKDAFSKGGIGRGRQNKMSRRTKRKLDRQVDKKRRREDKKECVIEL